MKRSSWHEKKRNKKRSYTGIAAIRRRVYPVDAAWHNESGIFYAPRDKDKQYPHLQDELYLVASGSGTFYNKGSRHPFQAGDVLFVAAGHEHRFEDFTPDFATLVIFYGPEGGESFILTR
jgi:mannose-6-phosphate isomerase-like protein (cupin superfamily)